MTLVKICGIKTAEEVSILNKYEPDFAGFVFSKSKRIVDIEKAAYLVNRLSGKIKKVGVFVNEPLALICEAYKKCGLDVIQLHGEEDSEYINKLKSELGGQVAVWKGYRIKSGDEIYEANGTNADAILLDSYSEDSYGGTGKAFNWEAAKDFADKNYIVLAGGLNPQNVKLAVEKLRPYCVDVSSGVEINGFKDEILVRDFILEAKKAVKL